MPYHAELLERGVWIMPYLTPTGHRVMAAIAGNGIMVDWRVYPPTDPAAEREANRSLAVSLNRLDPRPALQVVS